MSDLPDYESLERNAVIARVRAFHAAYWADPQRSHATHEAMDAMVLLEACDALKARLEERMVKYCVCSEQQSPVEGCDCVCCTTTRLEARLAEAEIALQHVLNATGTDGMHANEFVHRFAAAGLRATDSAPAAPCPTCGYYLITEGICNKCGWTAVTVDAAQEEKP